jgi:hypothetical protein
LNEALQKPAAHRLRIWNDPESRIAFLETVMEGKDWEAVIYEPPKGTPAAEKPHHSLEEIQKELRKKDYITDLGMDDEGNRTLTVKHFGKERGFITNIQELGLVQGWHRTWDHLPETFSASVKTTKDFGNYIVGDKARFLSGLYIAGDLMMMAASAISKSPDAKTDPFLVKMKRPEQALHFAASILSLGTTLILMNYGRDGSEIRLDELRKHMDDALGHGVAPSDVLKYKGEDIKKEGNFVDKFIKQHPLETASTFQILTGLANLGSGYYSMKVPENRSDPAAMKNIKYSMAGSATSIAGWGLLAAPVQNLKDQNGDPAFIAKYQEECVSTVQILASLLRMHGARASESTTGEKNKGNAWTMASEGTFILGDMTMWFLNAKEYGAHGAANPDMTAHAASTFISSMPMVLGQEEEQKFIGDLSNYLARQMVEEQMGTEEGRKKADGKNEDEMTAELAGKISKATRKELMGKERKLGVIVNAAANIAHAFPDAQQDTVIDALTTKISDMSGVYIEKDKLRALIDAEERTLVMMDAGGVNVVKQAPKMADVAKYISSVVSALPPMNAAENASLVYDAIAPMMETSPRDALYMQQAMKEKTAEKTGISPAMLAAQRSQNTVAQPSTQARL